LNRQFQVPIIFYCPGKINPGIRDRIAQQIDIMPTLLDFVGYDECFNAFGISLFSDSSNITYQLNNDIYQIQDDQYLLLFDGIRFIEQYAINPGNELNRLFITRENDSVRYLENKLKAIVQTQKSQLITNGFCSCK
ncbi:MAG: hypothetical protein JW973_14115, partial [Bacteroidales bacterium]|nr:hypothetical protein [Bacteroidales bacterium]